MMIPPQFYNKRFDVNHYNCSHFATDVIGFYFNSTIKEDLSCFLLPEKNRYADFSIRRKFHNVTSLNRDFGDIVVLHSKQRRSHVAVFVGNGFIHLSKEGVFVVSWDLLNIGYNRSRVYRHVSRCNSLHI